jgi:hypothetical protein
MWRRYNREGDQCFGYDMARGTLHMPDMWKECGQRKLGEQEWPTHVQTLSATNDRFRCVISDAINAIF